MPSRPDGDAAPPRSSPSLIPPCVLASCAARPDRGYGDYEYVVAVAGLEYMTDDACSGVGYDESGDALYAAVQPLAGGAFRMGLYSDAQCLVSNARTDYTYDDFVGSDDAVSATRSTR